LYLMTSFGFFLIGGVMALVIGKICRHWGFEPKRTGLVESAGLISRSTRCGNLAADLTQSSVLRYRAIAWRTAMYYCSPNPS
jgi:hypothetical protein